MILVYIWLFMLTIAVGLLAALYRNKNIAVSTHPEIEKINPEPAEKLAEAQKRQEQWDEGIEAIMSYQPKKGGIRADAE
jgi:hypothetical protein